MNILIVSWRDYATDGRLIELVNSFSQVGEVYLISTDKKPQVKNNICVDNSSFLSFVKDAIRNGKELKNIDVIVSDDRRPIIPCRIIKKKAKIPKMVLDCRETYFFEDVKHASGKFGCVVEANAIKRADVVITANQERAEITQKRYNLKETPLVFENIRNLAFSNDYNETAVREKYRHIFNSDKCIVLATSGCDADRMTDILVENFPKVKHKCRLIIAGRNFEADETKVREIIRRNNSDNIEIIGKVNHDELKFLTQNCDVGIVNYCQKDLNYKYCASGKIYEFLFEGIPVVTTTNPPLARMCEEEKIGVADDTFAAGIDTVLDQLEYYKSNVQKFAEQNTVEENEWLLARELKERLS